MTLRIALAGVFLLSGGCASPSATGSAEATSEAHAAMRSENTGAVMRRWIEEVWHRGRLELVPHLVAPRYTRHEDEGTYTVTAADYAEQIRNLRQRFPNLRYEVHDSASIGDRFWIRYTFRGGPDSTGPWPKRPGLQVYRLEGGRLAETWMLLRSEGTEWTDPLVAADDEPVPDESIPACPTPLSLFVKVTLYMDLSNRNDSSGWIDEEEQRVLRREVLQRHLPGAAMWESRGWWTRPNGSIARGPGLIITHTRPAQQRDQMATAIEATMAEIQRRYGQESVLWEEHSVCARF